MDASLFMHRGAISRGRGFTLIEVMIVVAILGIVSAIALPSYRAHIDRSRRADARTQLLQAAQFMQRFYTANDSYQYDRAANSSSDQMPAQLKQSPADSSPVYALTVNASTSDYTLTMAPVAGSPLANDACGAFTLTATGVRGVTGTKSRDECWK